MIDSLDELRELRLMGKSAMTVTLLVRLLCKVSESNPQGKPCDKSSAQMARALGMAPTTVKRGLHEAARTGFIKVRHRGWNVGAYRWSEPGRRYNTEESDDAAVSREA